MKNVPDSQQDKVLEQTERGRNPQAAEAHEMVTQTTPDQAEKLMAAVRDKTQYVIGKPETALGKLSPENREFLNRPQFLDDYNKCLGVLKARNLAEGAPDYEQSIAFLADLHEKGEINLDKIRTSCQSPKLVVAPELTPEDINALTLRNEKDFYCFDPQNPIFFGGKTPEVGGEKKARKFDIRIVESAADDKLPYLPLDRKNSDSDHFNNGKNYDYSRNILAADKMQHPSPSAYFVLATAMKEANTPIDLAGVCFLDMGEREKNPLVPVGDTFVGKVYLNRRDSDFQLDDIRVRPSAGGIYVPEKK